MKRFLAATKNKGKLKEIKEILSGFPFEVVSMLEAGIEDDIEENGATFEENAIIKAREIYKLTGEMVMADDSGLEVDFLNGAPGVYSARFAGIPKNDEANNAKLLNLMSGVAHNKRTARFVCAIAVFLPDGRYFTVRGTCEGLIGSEPAGSNGFGYDPLFYLPEYDLTMAQLSSDEKNRISHRGKALDLMAKEIRKALGAAL